MTETERENYQGHIRTWCITIKKDTFRLAALSIASGQQKGFYHHVRIWSIDGNMFNNTQASSYWVVKKCLKNSGIPTATIRGESLVDNTSGGTKSIVLQAPNVIFRGEIEKSGSIRVAVHTSGTKRSTWYLKGGFPFSQTLGTLPGFPRSVWHLFVTSFKFLSFCSTETRSRPA